MAQEGPLTVIAVTSEGSLTAPQNKVTITLGRHSRMLPRLKPAGTSFSGNPEKSLDVHLRGHDGWISDTYLYGA